MLFSFSGYTVALVYLNDHANIFSFLRLKPAFYTVTVLCIEGDGIYNFCYNFAQFHIASCHRASMCQLACCDV